VPPSVSTTATADGLDRPGFKAWEASWFVAGLLFVGTWFAPEAWAFPLALVATCLWLAGIGFVATAYLRSRKARSAPPK
jgi:hypothetical protein